MHTDVRAHLRGGRPSSACVYEYLYIGVEGADTLLEIKRRLRAK